jgi:hypothetical protein
MDDVELPPLVSELRNPVREHGIGPIWDAIFDWADGEEGSPATGLLADRINDAINEHMGDFARAAILADRERRRGAATPAPPVFVLYQGASRTMMAAKVLATHYDDAQTVVTIEAPQPAPSLTQPSQVQGASNSRQTSPADPPNPLCGISTDGINVWGDEASIKRVKDWMHAATGVVPNLRQRLEDAEKRAITLPPDVAAVMRLALDALGHFDDVDKTDAAIDALRAVLDGENGR